MDNPTTKVISHWVAWGTTENCPDEFIEFSGLRALQFANWLEEIKMKERDRAIEIFNRKTFHYGKTHSATTECRICDAFLEIDGNNND